MTLRPAWPLPDALAPALDALAALIARDGAWRVLAGDLVHTGTRDLPDPWTPTHAGVARMLARLAWLARLPAPVTLDDARRAAPPGPTRITLRTTTLAPRPPATLRLDEIGEAPDAAAALALGLGALTAGQDRALAGALYLGFGVLVLTAPPSEGVDPEVARALLAVLVEVRDAPTTALGSLGASAAAHLAPWRAAVAGHAAELRDRLGLATTEADPAPPRPLAPPLIVDDPEAEARLRPFNAGAEVHRVPRHHGVTGAIAAGIAGLGSLLLLGGAGMAVVPVAAAVGYLAGRFIPAGFACDDPRCDWPLPPAATTCPRCGGTIVGEVAFVARA